MRERLSAKDFLAKRVTRKDRVLLLNPPVEETRYSWVRWNQPGDLLRIGGYLRSQLRCRVDFLDLMKPDKEGKVPETWLTGTRRYRHIGGERYPMRRFGLSADCTLNDWVAERRATDPKGLPTQVWITSLCSYWSDAVDQACRVIRSLLPDVVIVLLGNYPRLCPADAETSIANVVVTSSIDLPEVTADLDLYGAALPPFVGVTMNAGVAVREIEAAVRKGVVNFTFFADDILHDEGAALVEIVSKTRSLHRHLRFHVTCGLYANRVTAEIAKLLANPKLFASLHFEEADPRPELDVASYRQARSYLEEGGLELPDARLSGFVWIGRPHETIDALVLKTSQVLDCLGGVILKPFTPTPGSPEHREHATYLKAVAHANWSPHFFPFAELNGISREEYHDLYRLAAFLNEKVRSSSFDFLSGTLGAGFLRESLRREVWKLEPSPLRVINQPTDL